MKSIVKPLDSFINEARKWKTSGLPLALKEIYNLPEYKALIQYGFVDVSSLMQKKRLNFRFRISGYVAHYYSFGVMAKDGEQLPFFYMCDVNQRSGRIQTYLSIKPGNKSNIYNNGNKIKSLDHPIETLEDYKIMFKHLLKYIDKKTKSFAPRYVINRQFTEEELDNIRVDKNTHATIKELW